MNQYSVLFIFLHHGEIFVNFCGRFAVMKKQRHFDREIRRRKQRGIFYKEEK
jgi:hypothetical protein